MKYRLNIVIASVLVMVLLVPFVAMAGGKTEIEFWTTETEEERMAVIKDLVKEFEKLNPDIKVNVVAVQENDVPTKLAAGMAAGMLPEVVEMGAENILRLGAEGLMDVEAAGQIIDELGREDFYKGALRMVATPEGGNYAVPMHGWVQGIWYRTDLFEEKGLEPPITWENILKAAEAFYNPEEQKYGIVIGTGKDSYTRQTFTQYALSNNARIFDENGNIIFNSPEMIETLDFYKKLAQFTPPGPDGWRDARDLYLSGRVPMMMYSTYIMDDIGIGRTGYEGAIVENLVDKTALANVMIHKSPATYGQIVALGILRGNKKAQVEAAKKFVKYLMSDTAYIKFLHMAPGGMNPVRRSIAQDPRYLDNPVLKVYGEKAAEIAAGLDNIGKFGYVNGKVFPEIGKITSQFIIGQAIMKMTENGWSAEEAAKWAQKEMEQAVRQ
ncbi:hypothetical protein BBF96_10660 [Anoxybacter fermentans]|uniref:Sugar ABC transporter substrate-binding protein n=1 Tax=Anoxybacter fermentans TaxID=1323375 RepID=A0A3S9SZN5_9FIRM|nr:sugar ABC transporter substrate-binding protein [Anoxybacter fermentans]AZR73806.1 hypothetical protein BBF96_10660 [Anoxybacter fermentans]